ncbi:hypothetical protein KAX75_10280 [candidate division WOR-3 bacterium]|nr:hypothetical protein [candidate division WOR-3 bacterium]
MECNDGVIAKKIVIASILPYSLPKQSQCWGQAPTLLAMIVNMRLPHPSKTASQLRDSLSIYGNTYIKMEVKKK